MKLYLFGFALKSFSQIDWEIPSNNERRNVRMFVRISSSSKLIRAAKSFFTENISAYVKDQLES